MGTAYGSQVYYWRAKVVSDQTASTDTTATVRVRAYWCSVSWGYSVTGNTGTAYNGSYSTSATFTASSSYGATVETLVATRSVTYTKSSSSQTISCKAVIKLTGGYHNGTSTATTTQSVAAITYSTPNAPSSCSATRNSDSKATVTWSNGSTSTTRPRSRTYVERQTGSGSWTQLGYVGSSTTSYTDSSITTNQRYRYRVRAYGSGGYSSYATSGYIYTTPAAPTSVTAAVVEGTTVNVTVAGLGTYATSWQLQQQLEGESDWTTIGTGLSTSSLTQATTVSGSARWQARSVYSSLYSSWTQSSYITTICPPNAPTISLSPSTVMSWGETLTISWVPDHPDGSAQQAAKVTVTTYIKTSDSDDLVELYTREYDIEGDSTSITYLPEYPTYEGEIVYGQLQITASTKGADEEWGATTTTTIQVYQPPQITITSPATDDTEVGELPLPVEWEIVDPTGVASQTLTLSNEDGTALTTLTLSTSARNYDLTFNDYLLENLTRYCLTLTVIGGSTLSTSAERWFTTDWTEPAPPDVWVEEGEGLSAEIRFQEGEEQELEDLPETSYFTVIRQLIDGSQHVLEDAGFDGQTVIDRLPPLNTTVYYLVTAWTETGASSTTTVEFKINTLKSVYNFGDDASIYVEAELNQEFSESPTVGGEVYHFADGGENDGLPSFYGTDELDISLSHDFVILDAQAYASMREIYRNTGEGWYRCVLGHRHRVRAELSFDTGYDTSAVEVGVSMEELSFREAISG